MKDFAQFKLPPGDACHWLSVLRALRGRLSGSAVASRRTPRPACARDAARAERLNNEIPVLSRNERPHRGGDQITTARPDPQHKEDPNVEG
jgi:hypothetical protein